MDSKLKKLIDTITKFNDHTNTPWSDCKKFIEVHQKDKEFKDLYIHYKDVLVLNRFIKDIKNQCVKIQQS